MTWLLLKSGVLLLKVVMGSGSFLLTLELYFHLYQLGEALRPKPVHEEKAS